MKKLSFISFLFLAQSYIALNAMEQDITIGGLPVTAKELAFELYCRDSWCFKPDKNKVLEYIADPGNNINKKFSGAIVIGGETLRMVDDDCRIRILRRACMSREDKNIVQALLARNDIDVDVCGKSRITALQSACFSGDEEVVRWLLERGADVNIVDEIGRTALVDACRNGGRISIVELLLSHKDIDINKGTMDKGQTPLLFYAAQCNINLLHIFFDSGKVKIHQKNDKNQTWFYVASYYGCYGLHAQNNALNIISNWDDYQKELFLDQELHALSKIYNIFTNIALRKFIQFCVKSGAILPKKNKQGKRPVDSAYDVYSQLQKLVPANNPILIVKEQVLHALLFETSSAPEENKEYGLERMVALYIAHHPESYNYAWNKQQKKAFRREILEAQ
jgi:hypothetical protein